MHINCTSPDNPDKWASSTGPDYVFDMYDNSTVGGITDSPVPCQPFSINADKNKNLPVDKIIDTYLVFIVV